MLFYQFVSAVVCTIMSLRHTATILIERDRMYLNALDNQNSPHTELFPDLLLCCLWRSSQKIGFFSVFFMRNCNSCAILPVLSLTVTPPLCDWLGFNIVMTTSLNRARGEEQLGKVSSGLHLPYCFSFAEFLCFCAENSIYSLIDILSGYVCCFWMCLDAGECFLLNFKPFGVNHSLGERICVFSVGNRELIC